jgi:hypothetical protein
MDPKPTCTAAGAVFAIDRHARDAFPKQQKRAKRCQNDVEEVQQVYILAGRTRVIEQGFGVQAGPA